MMFKSHIKNIRLSYIIHLTLYRGYFYRPVATCSQANPHHSGSNIPGSLFHHAPQPKSRCKMEPGEASRINHGLPKTVGVYALGLQTPFETVFGVICEA